VAQRDPSPRSTNRSRYRSVTYDLDASVAVARVVEDLGGVATPAQLAPALGYSGVANGAFLSRLANARLFGLVAGRTSRRLSREDVTSTDRARAILGGDERAAAAARRAAFSSVPLFRAVLEGGQLPEGGAPALAEVLVRDFGEVPGKAPATAAKLLASAGQAGLLAVGDSQNFQFKAVSTNFTDHRRTSRPRFVPGVVSRYRTSGGGDEMAPRDRQARRNPEDVEETGLWLDDDLAERPPGRPGRRVGVVAAAAACLALVAVPLGLVLSATGAPSAAPKKQVHLGQGPAEQQVLAALSATTDSNSFDMSYQMTETGPNSPVETKVSYSCPPQSGPVATAEGNPASANQAIQSSGGGANPHWVCSVNSMSASYSAQSFSGQGVINVDPKAMVATASVAGGVTVRVDSDGVWEYVGTDAGTAPGPGMGGGFGDGGALSEFASIVESTLGNREGAVSMLGLASPVGYLNLDRSDVTGAAQVSTGTVGGAPVTEYQVSEDPSHLVRAADVTPDQVTTIQDAVGVLDQEGYTGTMVTVAVDANGYIREATSVTSFGDGGTVTLQVDLSNFGCAGTVLMPGQPGNAAAPPNCVSPDAANGSTTTSSPTTSNTPTTVQQGTTATTAPTSSATTAPPSAPTTVARRHHHGADTTTTAPSTTTTAPPTTVTTATPTT